MQKKPLTKYNTHVKSIGEIRNSRCIPKYNKSNIQQTNSQYQTKQGETQSNPIKIRDKTKLPLSPYLFKVVLEVLSRAIRQQKEIKGIQTGKEEVKISLFADDITVYVSDPKNSTRELLNLIINLSKVAGYKVTSHKSLSFLYSQHEQDEKEISGITAFIIITNNIEYLDVTQEHQVQKMERSPMNMERQD